MGREREKERERNSESVIQREKVVNLCQAGANFCAHSRNPLAVRHNGITLTRCPCTFMPQLTTNGVVLLCPLMHREKRKNEKKVFVLSGGGRQTQSTIDGSHVSKCPLFISQHAP